MDPSQSSLSGYSLLQAPYTDLVAEEDDTRALVEYNMVTVRARDSRVLILLL